MSEEGFVRNYLKLQEEYIREYGPDTLLLMQKGTFYNSYEYDPQKDSETHAWPEKKIGNLSKVSKVLNDMTITRDINNKPYSLKNPSMLGFPCVAYENHRNSLLDNDFTIIRYDQRKEGDKVFRFKAETLSPATNLQDISDLPVNNNIVSIYIEVQKTFNKYEDYLLTVGISSIDVTTGDNNVSEIYSKHEDPVHALQETYRLLNNIRPREAILYLNFNHKDSQKYANFLHSTLELEKIGICNIKINQVDPEYKNPNYAISFLSKLFSPSDIKRDQNILEVLGLERQYYGTISYLLLLQYCYKHNETLIEKISPPNTSWVDENSYLILTHNASNQINLQPPREYTKKVKKINSLLSVVNFTGTNLGKRYLINRLENPITNIKTLNSCYDMTEDLTKHQTQLSQISSIIKKIPDLYRYHRNLYLKTIKPKEFVILFRAYTNIVEICNIIKDNNLEIQQLMKSEFMEEFTSCLSSIITKIDMNVLFVTNLTNSKLETQENIFHSGIDSMADNYVNTISKSSKIILEIKDYLNSFLGKTKGKKLEFVLENKSRNVELGFYTTSHKGKVLKSAQYDANICGELHFINVNKQILITSDIIASTFKEIKNGADELGKYLYSCYNNLINTLLETYSFYRPLSKMIAQLDFITSNAKCAIANKYYKPTIDTSVNYSYFDIKNIRHPIIEKLIDTEYVTNDISLGKKETGILLYGANSVGKSAISKAVGLNIILAQAGLFTAGEMTYYPYNKIITRLSGDDNLLQGESSFIVEVKEMRTILRNLDRNNLVLGDELCRGTETQSGTGLTVSLIEKLIESKTSFICSTHMHHLPHMPQIKKLPKDSLRICHLLLKHDREKNRIIYDRKLKEGQGDSIYGLEVAASLSLGTEFIGRASEIRKYMLNENPNFMSTKKSKYNSKNYVDSCVLCGQRDKLHSHHHKEQHTADKNGFIGTMHKNILGNMSDVCEECHKNLHKIGLKLVTEETSQGLSLSVVS